ncbi:MAG TPA: PIN domain-containing protein [Gammaproteobacteria bacterium]|nr:PIN domain-containing protein [Gammaproteobacteria bacterium]
MSGKFFLDTNILVYTFDATAPAKQQIARELVSTALNLQQGIISYQVVQEFLNVATCKFSPSLTLADTNIYLDKVLTPLCELFPCMSYYSKALGISDRWGFSLYDSLIITASLEAGCETLYTEDLQHGQIIQSLTIIDPFQAQPGNGVLAY